MQMLETDLQQFIVDNFLFGQLDSRLSNETSLLEAGIIDSTGVLELVTFLEEKYGVKLNDDEILPENLDTISNLVRFVGRKLEAVNCTATTQ